MKKIKSLIIVAICVFSCVFFALHMNQSNDSIQAEEFFFWMDGYVCFPVNTPYTLAFTYCYKDATPQLVPENILEIKVTGYDNITCRLLSAEQSDEIKFGYNTTTYVFGFESSQMGECSFSELAFIGKDGSEKAYPIGNWVFDIDVKPSGPYETIFSNVSTTNSSEKYMYEFIIPNQCKLLKIYYWNGASVDFPDNRGEIALDQSSAPVKVVRPKLELEIDGQSQISYGSISYCGALKVTQDDFNYARD